MKVVKVDYVAFNGSQQLSTYVILVQVEVRETSPGVSRYVVEELAKRLQEILEKENKLLDGK
jgi:hypothetical protein